MTRTVLHKALIAAAAFTFAATCMSAPSFFVVPSALAQDSGPTTNPETGDVTTVSTDPKTGVRTTTVKTFGGGLITEVVNPATGVTELTIIKGTATSKFKPTTKSGDVTTVIKDPNTGVTVTTVKTPGGTTSTAVFDPATGVTSTVTPEVGTSKTFTSLSRKDPTTGITTTQWTDTEGITGTTTEETDPGTGIVTKTTERSDGTTSVVKRDKDGNLKSKSSTNTKKGYKEDYEVIGNGYNYSYTMNYKVGENQFTESHYHRVGLIVRPRGPGDTEGWRDTLLKDGKTVYDISKSKAELDQQMGYIRTTEYFNPAPSSLAGVRSRLTDFYPKTGETSVTLVMLDGTIKEVTQGSEQQPQTTTPTETGKPKKEVKQTETGQSQGKPGKRPKKEVKHTGTAVKHIPGKHNAKPETSTAGHPVIELGAGILLNQLGHGGWGHDMGHHEMNGFMHGGNRGMMLGL